MFKALEIFFLLAAVVAGPMLAVMVVPALVKRFLGTPQGGGARRAELGDLRDRIDELDGLASRVAELEERVDFAERLLARQRESDRLARPGS